MFEASTLSGLDALQREQYVPALPGGRLIEPAEIADMVALDASLGLGANPGLLAD